MSVGGAQVPDRHADHEFLIEARMGKEVLATRVDGVYEPFVESVELEPAEGNAPRFRPEADDTERHRRDTFEVRMLINPTGEFSGKPHVLPQYFTNTRGAEVPQDHPQLES